MHTYIWAVHVASGCVLFRSVANDGATRSSTFVSLGRVREGPSHCEMLLVIYCTVACCVSRVPAVSSDVYDTPRMNGKNYTALPTGIRERNILNQIYLSSYRNPTPLVCFSF